MSSLRSLHVGVCSLAALGLWAAPAAAEVPLPLQSGCADANDDGLRDDPAHCPNDFGEEWGYLSYVTADQRPHIRQQEWSMGSGGSIDRAWQRTTGDWRVVIAVMDSGIRWGSTDLTNKFYLNQGELLEPQTLAGVAVPDLYDLNADGVFNMEDYADDPRVEDLNGNGLHDPEDLILDSDFSNGDDADGNGYVDDISGWDFMWNDNDARDDTNFGHGSGEAHDSSAEANNGGGTPGGCPNCAVMMVRIGDAFVVDANNWAEGAIFAVDSGAKVLQYAVGAVNATPLMQQAVNYAFYNGVVNVASAADETAQHPNFPGTAEHTIYVHAIRYDDEDEDRATTYLNYSNCTNFGGHLALSAPATGCSSGATGWLSGMAGLVMSAALQANVNLTGHEIYQLFTTTADDIDVPESLPSNAAYDGTKYPSGPGWDLHFGYGRPNARRAVDAVLDGHIPPEVDIASPGWFEILDTGATVPIGAYIAANRADSFHYVVEWAAGAAPDDTRGGDGSVNTAVWHQLSSGDGTAAINGTVATFDPASVPVSELDPEAKVEKLVMDDTNVSKSLKVNRFALTLRIRVTDNTGLRGEARKTVYLNHDPDLMPGFPMRFDTSFESSPKLADLDQDGVLDIVVGGADGRVYAIKGDGSAVPGWPVSTEAGAAVRHPTSAAFTHGIDGLANNGDELDKDQRSSVLATVGIGDLTGNGGLEVVAATFDGKVYVWNAAGVLQAGWPVQIGWADKEMTRRLGGADTNETDTVEVGVFSSPALGDLDGDGTLEIIFGGMDQLVYAFHADGTMVSGWPVMTQYFNDDFPNPERDRVMSSAALGDINNDGSLDVVVGTNESVGGTFGLVYAIQADGYDHAGGPFLPGVPGNLDSGWPIFLQGAYTNALPLVAKGVPGSPALADLDGDGELEVFGSTIADFGRIYRSDGTIYTPLRWAISDFGPSTNSDEASMFVMAQSAAFGDLDNKPGLELVMGGAGITFANNLLFDGVRADFDHLVTAWHATNGRIVEGFPQIMDDLQFFMNSIIADIDGDGFAETIQGSGSFVVRAFDYTGKEPAGWPKFTGHWLIASPAAGDIDGDGKIEVIGAARNGYLFAWRTQGAAPGHPGANVQWAGFHHDARNTGNYATLDPALGITPLGDNTSCPDGSDTCEGGDSCGCSGTGGAAGSGLFLVLVLFTGTLGRKRRRS